MFECEALALWKNSTKSAILHYASILTFSLNPDLTDAVLIPALVWYIWHTLLSPYRQTRDRGFWPLPCRTKASILWMLEAQLGIYIGSMNMKSMALKAWLTLMDINTQPCILAFSSACQGRDYRRGNLEWHCKTMDKIYSNWSLDGIVALVNCWECGFCRSCLVTDLNISSECITIKESPSYPVGLRS